MSLIEKLSKEFHRVYQEELKRQRKKSKYSDNYDELSEEIKDLDRALAKFVIKNFISKQDLRKTIDEVFSQPPKNLRCSNKEWFENYKFMLKMFRMLLIKRIFGSEKKVKK